MTSEIALVLFVSTIAIFMCAASVGILVYEKSSKKKALVNVPEDDWLFSGFHELVFSITFRKKNEETYCGINNEEYTRFCKILHIVPNLKRLAAMRVEAVLLLLVFMTIPIVFEFDLMTRLAFCIIGFIFYYYLWNHPYKSLKLKAEERLFRIQDDLPRFLALLEKAMDLPIDQAIIATASKFESPLSDDLMDSIMKVSLGANGWQEPLTQLAECYRIEDFSDLVLEIINAYEQGVDIRELVIRKASDVEKNRLLAVEAHDATIKSLLTLPIMVLKILPLMAMICIPMVSDITGTGVF